MGKTDIRKVKFNYSKKEKKIHLSEIFNAVKEYCDELKKFKGSNSISEQLIYVYAKPESTKEVIEEAYKNRHFINGRCKCAKTIYDAFNNLINNIVKIGEAFGKIRVDIIQKDLTQMGRKLVENDLLEELPEGYCDFFIKDKIYKIQDMLTFLDKENKISNKCKVDLVNNISEVSKSVVSFYKKIDRNSKIHFALADLKYLSSSIFGKNLKKDIEATKKTVSEVATAINNLIDFAESRGFELIDIKKKDPAYYLKMIKATQEHYITACKSLYNRIHKIDTMLKETDLKEIKNTQEVLAYNKTKNSFIKELRTLNLSYLFI